MLIAPSILAGDFANLQAEIERLNQSEADWIHVDIMDGVFVPNISMGLPIVNAIKKHASKPLDVHLMIVHPEKYLDAFRLAGASSISIHIEACPNLHRDLEKIKSLGCRAGIAVNPHTAINSLEDILVSADMICLMGVNPGFGGQSLIPHTVNKIRALKDLITRTGSSALIEVDGGVTMENAKALAQAGTDVLVAGSVVFAASDPLRQISQLKRVTIS